MSSHGRTRDEERRFNMRTLAIASLASATAAILTSQFWIKGTPIAAAVTPVIVAFVSELLHRPTERIVERFTAETQALPEAAGAGPPPPAQSTRPRPATEPPEQGRPVSVHRPPGLAGARRLPWRVILVTSVLAFAIGAAIITLPELIAGQSIGKGDGKTSILGNDGRGESSRPSEPAPEQPDPAAPPQTAPAERTAPSKEPRPAETAPATPPQETSPQETTTAPEPQATAPAAP